MLLRIVSWGAGVASKEEISGVYGEATHSPRSPMVNKSAHQPASGAKLRNEEYCVRRNPCIRGFISSAPGSDGTRWREVQRQTEPTPSSVDRHGTGRATRHKARNAIVETSGV